MEAMLRTEVTPAAVLCFAGSTVLAEKTGDYSREDQSSSILRRSSFGPGW